jgi:hypothetical protein
MDKPQIQDAYKKITGLNLEEETNCSDCSYFSSGYPIWRSFSWVCSFSFACSSSSGNW